MEPPKGHPDHNKYIWKLKKAIYGLKQSGMEWNNELNGYLLNIGFKRLTCEPCIYFTTDKHNKITCLIAVYVDDILLAGNKAKIDQIKNMIKNKFKIKEIGVSTSTAEAEYYSLSECSNIQLPESVIKPKIKEYRNQISSRMRPY